MILIMNLALIICLVTVVRAASPERQKTSLEDIERDYNPSKANRISVGSPTKFGFVPQRTAPSYAASQPKYQFNSQTNYQVNKKTTAKAAKYMSYQPQHAAQGFTQPEYQLQYQQPSQQYQQPSKQYQQSSQQYQQTSQLYQQPTQQYDQYENVQYVTDNSISQLKSQQPQYYYVQQYPASSTAVESVVDPKGMQYVYFPSYSSANSITTDQKYLQQYLSGEDEEQPQLPAVTTTVKYTSVPTGKSSTKNYFVQGKGFPYEAPKVQYQPQPQEDVVIKREPKSLLDSYVPSIVQLQYLKQQGKLMSYTKF
ncbi:putative cyclin-dependent serine/threonine-protein kinase DDB_G0272797/DDB_G0274007 isoform X2 [Euwallacea fornicatus]|uniref:putative cyclin-dependent serine/threonine-protein kinase DDB_G0272797/DDB_G0274007 isoform X2 n=1 Tax=Euwallacea fornicatus TaxID=995702 RepID=UPI00338ECB7E